MVARKKTNRKKTSTKTKGGPKAYTPTKAEREIVSAMMAAGISTEIARKLIINPKTGKPFARSNFWKFFKAEIEFGGKSVTGRAVATLVKAMDVLTKDGEVSIVALRAAEFWLRTRESELFSERRINENIEKKAADEIGKINDEQAIRIADNVKAAAELNKKARAGFGKPSIEDEPQGHA